VSKFFKSNKGQNLLLGWIGWLVGTGIFIIVEGKINIFAHLFSFIVMTVLILIFTKNDN
jgi:hypothetical protein